METHGLRIKLRHKRENVCVALTGYAESLNIYDFGRLKFFFSVHKVQKKAFAFSFAH